MAPVQSSPDIFFIKYQSLCKGSSRVDLKVCPRGCGLELIGVCARRWNAHGVGCGSKSQYRNTCFNAIYNERWCAGGGPSFVAFLHCTHPTLFRITRLWSMWLDGDDLLQQSGATRCCFPVFKSIHRSGVHTASAAAWKLASVVRPSVPCVVILVLFFHGKILNIKRCWLRRPTRRWNKTRSYL